MSTAQQLQKALEERAKEIVELQRQIHNAELDRKKWENQRRVLESKHPPNVQALTREKRELQTQLQREESEKGELFIQMNKLIREMAECHPNAKCPALGLESRIEQLSGENAQLKANFGALKEERAEFERMAKTFEVERDRAAASAQTLQKEIEIKEAALQSLRLAKPSSKESDLETEVSKLRAELTTLQKSNSEALSQKSQMEKSKESYAATLAELEKSLAIAEAKVQSAESQKSELMVLFEETGVPLAGGVTALQKRVSALKADAEKKKLETEMDELRQTLNSANTARQELSRRIDALRDENERLTEKASVEEELHTLMNSLRDAKADISAKETEIADWRQKSLRAEELAAQLDAEVKRLRETLAKAEAEIHSLRKSAVDSEILSKLEADLRLTADSLEQSRRELVELKTSKERSERELSEISESRTVAEKRVAELETQIQKAEIEELKKRREAEERRNEELRRLREENRAEIDRIRRELVDERDRMESRMAEADAEMRASREAAEEQRRAADSALRDVAAELESSSLNVGDLIAAVRRQRAEADDLRRRSAKMAANADEMMDIRAALDAKTRQLEELNAERAELQRRVGVAETERRDAEIRATNELNRLKTKETTLESETRATESQLRDRIRALEAEEASRVAALGAATAQRQLWESDRAELHRMNAELRDAAKADQRRHDDEIRVMRDEMIENIRRLSDLLKTETERREAALSDVERLNAECSSLKDKLKTQSATIAPSDADLKAKVAELTEENAQLAGDLLKLQSNGADKSTREEMRQMERHFAEERRQWLTERSTLESELSRLRLTEHSNGNPKPKPRRLNGAPSTISSSGAPSESSSADESVATTNSTTNGVEIDPLSIKAEMERQKRLITVLRKKLQHQQIERIQQSRSFCASLQPIRQR